MDLDEARNELGKTLLAACKRAQAELAKDGPIHELTGFIDSINNLAWASFGFPKSLKPSRQYQPES